MIKWVLLAVGFYLQGVRGAIIGYCLGYFFNYFKIFSLKTLFTDSKDLKVMDPDTFNNHALTLSSFVIKADGIKQVELDFVRDFFVKNYGKERANASFRFFNEEIKKQGVSLEKTAQTVRDNARYASRLQIIHFLFGVAHSDGETSEKETQVIYRIAQNLGVSNPDYKSIHSMYLGNQKNNSYNPYAILGIASSATQAEVKQAYRTLVKRYHPDKLQHLGKAHQEGAQQKFQEIQKA